jgi:DNA-binding beta-propeller fold protein YncE
MKPAKLALPGLLAGLAACTAYHPAGVDDDTFTILAQGFALAAGSVPSSSFEGITVSEDGASVYVASFFQGTVVRMRANDLAIAGSTQLPQLVEGLTVDPNGGELLAVHKDEGLSVVAIPSLTPIALHVSGGGFFVESAGAGRALVSGGEPLALIDTESGDVLAEYSPPGAVDMWHFAVAPDGSQIAALRSDGESRSVHLLTPALQLVGSLNLNAYASLVAVAYHPGGRKLYILARDTARNDHLVVIDLDAGIARDTLLNPSDCSQLCVANPVARSREGRWIVFGGESSAYFIDTTQDRLVALLGSAGAGSGVAASPTEDAFFFLRHDGLVRKVSYPDL